MDFLIARLLFNVMVARLVPGDKPCGSTIGFAQATKDLSSRQAYSASESTSVSRLSTKGPISAARASAGEPALPLGLQLLGFF